MYHTPVGRFAPSPSGRMHLGNIFSALVAWLSVRSQNGRMVLRIEDLDPRCCDPKRAQQIIDDLRWLGLDWDEGPIYQHDRLDLYREATAELHADGLTYPCFCTRAELHAASAPHASDGTPVYAGTCRNLTAQQIEERQQVRPAALRLRVPDADDPAGTISFVDRVYGTQTETLARDCGDFLIQRSDGVYAYQLVVVVDDAEMGVTEVVRGRDLLSRISGVHSIPPCVAALPCCFYFVLIVSPKPAFDNRPLVERRKTAENKRPAVKTAGLPVKTKENAQRACPVRSSRALIFSWGSMMALTERSWFSAAMK